MPEPDLPDKCRFSDGRRPGHSGPVDRAGPWVRRGGSPRAGTGANSEGAVGSPSEPFDFEAGSIFPSTEVGMGAFVDPFDLIGGLGLAPAVVEPFDFEAGLIASIGAGEQTFVDPFDLISGLGLSVVAEEDLPVILGDLGTAATPGGTVGINTEATALRSATAPGSSSLS